MIIIIMYTMAMDGLTVLVIFSQYIILIYNIKSNVWLYQLTWYKESYFIAQTISTHSNILDNWGSSVYTCPRIMTAHPQGWSSVPANATQDREMFNFLLATWLYWPLVFFPNTIYNYREPKWITSVYLNFWCQFRPKHGEIS